MNELCGCGKPAKYSKGNISTGYVEHSCNKYKRCPSYDELKQELEIRTLLLNEAIKLLEYNWEDRRENWLTRALYQITKESSVNAT